jgi:hypothetical protein
VYPTKRSSTDTLPASDHACTSKLGRAISRVVEQELVELGHELLQLAEDEERAVFGPCWASIEVARLAN